MTYRDEGYRIGRLWLHGKEQWDLDCWPWLCAHWRRPNSSTRVFCLWAGGVQLGPLTITRRGVRWSSVYVSRWSRG
jgi:hypothetical protein